MTTRPTTMIGVLSTAALILTLGFAVTTLGQEPPKAATNGFRIYVPGVVKAADNYALQFDGVDDFASIVDTGDFDFDEAFTVEAWIKPMSIPPYEGGFRHRMGIVTGTTSEPPYSGPANHPWGLSQDLGWPFTEYNNVCFSVRRSDGASIGLCLGPLEQGRWDHFAATYRAGELHIFQNGIQDTFPKTIVGDVAPVGFVILGRQEGSFHGLLDEVRLWKVARTQAQIQADMNRTLNGNEPGLVGYWRLDEGTGQAILDSSLRGNDGRLGSTPGSDGNDPKWVVSDAPVH